MHHRPNHYQRVPEIRGAKDPRISLVENTRFAANDTTSTEAASEPTGQLADHGGLGKHLGIVKKGSENSRPKQ